MTKKEQDQVKDLLAQGYASTTNGTFSISLSGDLYWDLPMYTITIFMNFKPHMMTCYELERINDVCKVVGVFYMVKIVHGVPVIRIR